VSTFIESFKPLKQNFMKKLKLLVAALLMGCIIGLTAQEVPRLIFTEWAFVGPNYYIELTNMEDTAINLNDFRLQKYWAGAISGSKNPYTEAIPLWGITMRYLLEMNDIANDSMLGPKETFVIAQKNEGIGGPPNYFTVDREPLIEIADAVTYGTEYSLPEGVIDDSRGGMLSRGGAEPTYLWYYLPDGDSIAVDAFNNGIDPVTGKSVGPTSIAGIEAANVLYAFARRANITTGNLNWDLARGTDLSDTEWLPVPYDNMGNENWNPSLFTTIGTHGDYSIDFDSETLTIDHTNKTITVPWGYRKATLGTSGTHSHGIVDEIDFGPGMSYWYQEYADSSSSACQNGDMLEIYACGNDLEKATYTIIASTAADNNAKALPKRYLNELTEGFWTWSNSNDPRWRPRLSERYTVSEGVPVMDTISGIAFATRIDSLMAYLEIAPQATASFVFVDGEDRVDLKEGDILRITAGDGSTTKDYYLSLYDIGKSDNANLASITWPDLPFEMDRWKGDTIPGFAPGVMLYNFTVPYGMKTIPALAVSTENINAYVKTESATSLSGSLAERTSTITVTSQDSSKVKVYKVIFNAETLAEDIQPFKAEPIITEYTSPQGMTYLLEIANVGNQDIDLSEYLFMSSYFSNPAEAISNYMTTDSLNSYDKRYTKYIPGYKYGSYQEWLENPGTVKLDPDIDPILPAGQCFVMGKLHANYANPTSAFYCPPELLDIWWSEEPWENVHGEVFARPTPTAAGNLNKWTAYIFKIKPDSAAGIYDGSTSISDIGDYTLIDRLGGATNEVWNVAGRDIVEGMTLQKKPGAYLPNTEPYGGFGTNADDSDWTVDFWQENPDPIGNVAKIRLMWSDTKNYSHDPITFYMSTVSSQAYIVDDGYEGDLEIVGVLPNTSVTELGSILIRKDDGQVFKVLSQASAGDTLAVDDIIAQGDTLLVISADGNNMTKYILNVGALDDNAVLVAKEGSGYVVDITGETGTITGVVFGSTLNEILSNLEKPELALLNVWDADHNLVPTKVLNLSDSTYKEIIFTGGFFLEVIAQNNSKITYELLPEVTSSDAWLSSNKYTVNQENKVIYNVPEGISVEVFMGNIFAAGGASIELLDKAEFSRDSGYISLDDIIRVTSEDASTVVDYTLRFIGFELSGEAFVTSDIYDVNTDEASIGSVPAYTDVSVFLGNVKPAPGAIMVLKDAAGAEKESGEMLTGDVLVVTSEDGLNTVNYIVDVLLSTELSLLESVKVYPNPVNTVLNITGLEKQTKVELISITGQVLRVEQTSDQTYVMDMSNQESGYYILRISDKDQNARLFSIVCTR
jgi:hypothetical protein